MKKQLHGKSKRIMAMYVRVSTVSQNEAGQRAALQHWLDGNGVGKNDVEWFIDKESGDTMNRPEFERLQGAVFESRVHSVVVWKLDRLSRSLRDGLTTLCNWCDSGLRVVSVTQQIDFSGTIGKMIASVLFGVAEMEQETRRERQMAGIAVAKKNGVYFGRKPGTTKGSPEQAKKLRDQGYKIHEIKEFLGVSTNTVYLYLRKMNTKADK
jgi:DNA invertase Pin-like site-specific DNA recombinase